MANKISSVLFETLAAQRTNIFVANGVAAGQKAPHFMIHIIPRKDADSVTVFNIKPKEFSERELEAVHAKIRKAISSQ